MVPHDDRIRQWIEIPEDMALPARQVTVDRVGAAAITVNTVEDLDGMIVTAEILDFGDDGDRPVGRIIEILGMPGDFGIDVEILIRAHHIPHHFPDDVLEQARAIPGAIPPDELARRRDFRDLDIVTIDGETARDFDDAVWVEPLANGHWALQVHIADVSHYVRPGSPIDREAALRGTSVYFPDRAVPMLPVELSTDQCSLRPHEDRLVLSALLEIDAQGDVVSQEFTRGVIRSAERMTYTAVHGVLEGDPALRERYAPLVQRFKWMQELALILNRKRVRRGSIDFDLPEPLLEFNEFGEMTGVTRAPRNIAHRLIEEFMLAANEAVASHLEALEVPTIFRIHERPDPKRVLEFEEVATHFGYSLRGGAAPVKRFRRSGDRAGRRQLHLAQLPEAGQEDRRQTGRAHPELPDAPVAQASPLQRSQPGPLRAGRAQLHALHFAHSPLSRSDRASRAGRASRRHRATTPICAASRNRRPTPNAAPPKPSANWSSGRRSSS